MKSFALFSLLACVCAAMYSSKDAVVQLTAKNFPQVLESEHGWMVEFYAPCTYALSERTVDAQLLGCGHCKSLAPEYKKAASKMKGLVKFGAVDCDDAANQPVCGQYGIKGFPTLKFFQSDKVGPKKLPLGMSLKAYASLTRALQDYNGERVSKALIDYVSSRVSDKNVHVLSESKKGGKLALDDFYEKQNETVSKVLLFTNKKSTALLYKSLSLEFKGRLLFAEIRDSEKSYVANYAIETFPSLLVVKAGDNSVVKFEGSINFAELSAFLTPLAPEKKASAFEDKPVKREPFDANVPHVSTQEDLQKNCLAFADSGISSLCVLLFLPPLEKEYEESVKQHADLISLTSKIKKQMYTLVETDAQPTMHFLWLDGSSAAAEKIISRFGLSSELPSIMVISPKKKVYRPFLRAYEEKAFVSFLKETGRGGGKVYPYSWDIELPSADTKKAHDEL